MFVMHNSNVFASSASFSLVAKLVATWQKCFVIFFEHLNKHFLDFDKFKLFCNKLKYKMLIA